jgi:hypothetical protein
LAASKGGFLSRFSQVYFERQKAWLNGQAFSAASPLYCFYKYTSLMGVGKEFFTQFR